MQQKIEADPAFLGASDVIDPVCGMTVTDLPGSPTHEHAGTLYHFCSQRCADKFVAAPLDYLVDKLPDDGAPASGRYFCPMCEGVAQDHAGSCPKCGMALEAEIAVAAAVTRYTCPMHPEVVQEGPGECPICGMALEPDSRQTNLPPGTLRAGLGGTGASDAGSALGWLAVLCAGLELPGQPPSQYVHAD